MNPLAMGPEEQAHALLVRCPKCNMPPQEPCVRTAKVPHQTRLLYALLQQPVER